MMASSQLQNVYHLRTVAETSSKSCLVCYKPSTAVLITPDNKDFFYICRGHLKDRGFASPIIDEKEAAAKKRQEELDKEIELIKKEYEEKMKKKKLKAKASKDEKDSKDEKKSKDDEDEAKKLEKEKDEKIAAANAGSSSSSTDTGTSTATDDLPRIYALHRSIFQMRLDRIRNAEIAKRNRERLGNPTTFPSVPSGIP